MFNFLYNSLKFLLILIFLNNLNYSSSFNFTKINLPFSHLSYYFNQFPNIREKCLKDELCPYRNFVLNEQADDLTKCWGYEFKEKCNNRFSNPICPSDHNGWVKNKQAQVETFYSQTDFGYIKQQISELEVYCEPIFETDSFLECTKYLRFCRGKNIFINLTNVINQEEPTRYNTEVLQLGQIGGHCELNKTKFNSELDHLGALQSWAPELRNFVKLNRRPIVDDVVDDSICDVTIRKPAIIMKLDATTNMYHHFCDFFNLYASLHTNQTQPDSFDTDIHVLTWETYSYQSSFSETFRAFTNYPILDLKHFKGKTICFKNLVLPLLPRMIFGLYYNTPIISGCQRSGLFKAFSEFILHRLQIRLHRNSEAIIKQKLRITFLSRKTKYRQVLNEQELVDELGKNETYQIKVVSFEKGLSFHSQLEIIRNTDILIGMHGAGLTHLLFLPDWATIFELYNCEDPTCYKDLARLRGVNYLTWEASELVFPEDSGNHPQYGGAHAKFTNYKFDKNEFILKVNEAADYVLNEDSYKRFLLDIIENNFDRNNLKDEL